MLSAPLTFLLCLRQNNKRSTSRYGSEQTPQHTLLTSSALYLIKVQQANAVHTSTSVNNRKLLQTRGNYERKAQFYFLGYKETLKQTCCQEKTSTAPFAFSSLMIH